MTDCAKHGILRSSQRPRKSICSPRESSGFSDSSLNLLCPFAESSRRPASKNAEKLLMLARSMAQKRLEDPDAATPYAQSDRESGEAVRLYLEILKACSFIFPTCRKFNCSSSILICM